MLVFFCDIGPGKSYQDYPALSLDNVVTLLFLIFVVS